MPSAEDITRHWDADPHGVERVGVRIPSPVVVVDPDPTWPLRFSDVEASIRRALGATALAVEHIGSTSVPGLPAKPIIDVDLIVADPVDEAAYRPALEGVGLHLVLREPGWHEHRLFKPRTADAHVHVFGPESPEPVRHVLLRDWLRTHPDDAAEYAAVKRRAAVETNAAGGDGMDYNLVKEPYLRALLDRIFRAEGLR